MYTKQLLSLSQARQAIAAVIEAAMQAPDRPIAVALVDDDGTLVAYEKMDGCRPLPRELARKKAYTAAIMRTDTLAFAERMQQQGRSVSELGDPGLTAVQGGLAIQAPGRNVSGRHRRERTPRRRG